MDPDRRSHEEIYKGHRICVDAQREGAGGRGGTRSTAATLARCAPHAKLTDPEAAMWRAIQAARLRVDELGSLVKRAKR